MAITTGPVPRPSAPSQPLNAYAAALIALCLLVATVEGFDAIAMAIAAPILSKSWVLNPQSTGVLLTASVAGMTLGSFALAPFGDRFGRRPAILVSLAIAAVFTLAGAWADSYQALLFTRVLAGIGLGSAIPNVLSIAMEIAPARLRTYTVVLVACGYPLGAAVGSALIAPLVGGVHGHAAVFVVGGTCTLVVAFLCLLLLPESPSFLALRPTKAPQLARLTARLAWPTDDARQTAVANPAPTESPLRSLFGPQFRTTTLLIWLVGLSNMAIVFFFLSWLPTLLVAKGLALETAMRANAIFNTAGIVGGLLLAVAVSKLNSTGVFGACFTIAAVSVLAFAIQPVGPALWTTLGLAGASVVGSQFCFTAVVNQYYPAAIRATGAGYASGASRIGAIGAPLVGGWVMHASGSTTLTFAIAAIPAIIGLLGIIALHFATDFTRRSPA